MSESESLVAKLLPQYAVLLNQLVGCLGLVAVLPVCERGEEEPEGDGIGHQVRIIGSMGGCRKSCCWRALGYSDSTGTDEWHHAVELVRTRVAR